MNREIISYGQHFMKNEELLDELVSIADLSNEDFVMEVGAGDGRLTKKLAEKCGAVLSFEIDKTRREQLVGLGLANVNFVFQNVLDYSGDLPKKVVANLPYQITEPFVERLAKEDFSSAYLVVGKRFGLSATNLLPTKLSIMCHCFFRGTYVKDVAPENFDPAPKVYSSLIKLEKVEEKELMGDVKLFVFRYLFSRRDKKLKNALKEAIIHYYDLKGRFCSQNESRAIIEKYFSEIDLDCCLHSAKK
ncbi:MAG: hypothetical protein J6A28_02775 [Clostridia bacterium]|nr:hypothetical protein [Clostridia bacterium]